MKLYLAPAIIEPTGKEYGGVTLLQELAACAARSHPSLAAEAELWARDIDRELRRRLSVSGMLSPLDPQCTETGFDPPRVDILPRTWKIGGPCRVFTDRDKALELAGDEGIIEVESDEIWAVEMSTFGFRVIRRDMTPGGEENARSSPD